MKIKFFAIALIGAVMATTTVFADDATMPATSGSSTAAPATQAPATSGTATTAPATSGTATTQ